jgi:transposase
MSERQYKQGIDRQQGYLLPVRVEEYVREDNPVRAIDSYVESLDLAQLGFTYTRPGLTPGQPAYPPQALLKLYLYGYLHRVRSSRRLAAECQRNLEVIWLVEGLRPSYKTIADFRQDNLSALQAVNCDFVQLCKELELFGAEYVGIDGSFFRGNVAKGHIYTRERLQRALAHLETDIARYLEELQQADQAEAGQASEGEPELAQKLAALQARQQKRQEQLRQLEKSGASQVAEVDADARLLSKHGACVAGYNVQSAVDAQHKLLVTCAVTQDGNDRQQLLPMGQAAQAVLGVEQLVTTQDQGYFNAEQIQACLACGITPFVPEPDTQAAVRGQDRLPRVAFTYEAAANRYRCPAGQELAFHQSRLRGDKTVWDYRSDPQACAACGLRGQCLPAKMGFRTLTRWEHEEVLEAHRARMAESGAEKMRQRAGLCEHPFGTLKMRCGWTHFLLRGLAKVRAELSWMMLCYNFSRVLQILGLEAFCAYLRRRPALQRAGTA